MDIKLAETIKRLRTERGITQKALAKVFSVSPQAVSRWENGQAYPDTQMLPGIAAFLGITLDELMVGSDQSSLFDEQRTLEFAMKTNPSPETLMKLCDVLRRIVAGHPENPYYLGLYFQTMIRRKHCYGGVSEEQIEQIRDQFHTRLKTAEIEERFQLLREVINAEEEDKLVLWEKYAPKEKKGRAEFLWEDFLRFLCCGSSVCRRSQGSRIRNAGAFLRPRGKDVGACLYAIGIARLRARAFPGRGGLQRPLCDGC